MISIRVIHGPKDRVTPLDFKVHTFRVHALLPTYYHVQTEKNFFEPKGYFWTFYRIFFFESYAPIWVSNSFVWPS